MLEGNERANVCRIERADVRIASARGAPIVAVIHGRRMMSLKRWLSGRLRTHASTVISHGMLESTANRASCVATANSIARAGVASGLVDVKYGVPPAAGKTHRLPGAFSVSSAAGCSGS